jgi:hypothetical protein
MGKRGSLCMILSPSVDRHTILPQREAATVALDDELQLFRARHHDPGKSRNES